MTVKNNTGEISREFLCIFRNYHNHYWCIKAELFTKLFIFFKKLVLISKIKRYFLIFFIAFSTHSKPKRPQLRAAQNRYRKQKSLLCHLKPVPVTSDVPSPVIEELPSTEIQSTHVSANEASPSIQVSLPGCDRQTRGFRVHIERKTHTVTRTNKKQKLPDTNEPSTINVKQEPIEISNVISEASSSSSTTTTTGALTNHLSKGLFELY